MNFSGFSLFRENHFKCLSKIQRKITIGERFNFTQGIGHGPMLLQKAVSGQGNLPKPLKLLKKKR